MRKHSLVLSGLLVCTLLVWSATTPGCSDSEETVPDESGGAGGVGAAGGSNGGGAAGVKAVADYEKMFPQDRVPRLDITISASNWQAMVDNMTSLLGDFGSGGGLGPGGGLGGAAGAGPGGPLGMGGSSGLPPELTTACEGLAAGETCSASINGFSVSGTCTENGDQLACIPSGPPGGLGGGAGAGGQGEPPGGMGVNSDLIGETPIYAECDVSLEGASVKHAGVRFKGNSSLALPWQQGIWKLPLRLTFDKFEENHPETKNQRLHGFKALSLSNGSADSSLLRDKLGTEVFGKVGLPVPATAFYRVYIDRGDGPMYFGLYTAIELPSDDTFLEKQFGSDKGNLYKPDGTAAQWSTWDPPTLGKENNEDKADYSDARALFDALNGDRTDAAAWRTQLEAVFDVEGFLQWLALNTVIQDWDTYGRMAHNYYLYADPNLGNRLRWIPWDHSYAFSPQQAVSLSLGEISAQWPLIRFLLDDPVYQQKYRERVGQTVTGAYEAATMKQRMQAAHDLIRPYIVGPEGEAQGYTFLSSPTAFDDALAQLLAQPEQRATQVAEFLSKLGTTKHRGADGAHDDSFSSSARPGTASILRSSASLASRMRLRTVFRGAPVALATSFMERPSTTRSASDSACSSGSLPSKSWMS